MSIAERIGQAMRTVLKEKANELAHQTKFVKRQRKLTGADFVQTLVFGWLAEPDSSMSSLNQSAATIGVRITPQGLEQRFTPEAAEFLYQVLQEAVKEALSGVSVPIPLLERFSGVYVQDSTTVVLPEVLAELWTGCSGAALKVQVRWELQSGSLVHLDLRHGKEHDRSAPVQAEPIPAGALRLTDLGYFNLDRLQTLAMEGAYFLSRAWIQCLLEDSQGQKWDLVTLLKKQKVDIVDLSITLGATHHLPCRLLAVRVSPEVAAQRRRKLRANAKRRCQNLSQRQLILADWTILVTNAPPELLTAQEAIVLARVRWQVELLFKLWKSHAKIDQWRTQKPWRILCELYAKLLSALLLHWIWIASCWYAPNRSMFQAAHTIQLHAMSIASAFASGISQRLIDVLTTVQRCLTAGCRINKRKTRPHTFQLLLACTQDSLT